MNNHPFDQPSRTLVYPGDADHPAARTAFSELPPSPLASWSSSPSPDPRQPHQPSSAGPPPVVQHTYVRSNNDAFGASGGRVLYSVSSGAAMIATALLVIALGLSIAAFLRGGKEGRRGRPGADGQPGCDGERGPKGDQGPQTQVDIRELVVVSGGAKITMAHFASGEELSYFDAETATTKQGVKPHCVDLALCMGAAILGGSDPDTRGKNALSPEGEYPLCPAALNPDCSKRIFFNIGDCEEVLCEFPLIPTLQFPLAIFRPKFTHRVIKLHFQAENLGFALLRIRVSRLMRSRDAAAGGGEEDDLSKPKFVVDHTCPVTLFSIRKSDLKDKKNFCVLPGGGGDPTACRSNTRGMFQRSLCSSEEEEEEEHLLLRGCRYAFSVDALEPDSANPDAERAPGCFSFQIIGERVPPTCSRAS